MEGEKKGDSTNCLCFRMEIHNKLVSKAAELESNSDTQNPQSLQLHLQIRRKCSQETALLLWLRKRW